MTNVAIHMTVLGIVCSSWHMKLIALTPIREYKCESPTGKWISIK